MTDLETKQQHVASSSAATLAVAHEPGAALDAILPAAIARSAEDLGVKKASHDRWTLFALAVLAGAFIALGAMFATVTLAGTDGVLPYGISHLLIGAVFSLGLILVMVAGAQLFTGDALMVMAWASGRVSTHVMIRVWVLVWAGNFVGALGTAALVFLSGQYKFGHGAVASSVLYFASAKSNLPVSDAFFLGILCNVLVCLAVWLTLAARSVTDKVIAIFFPVTAFVAAGFEHCVANMYYVPLGLFVEWWAGDAFWQELGRDPATLPSIPIAHYLLNLGAVTLGNWFGGAVLVGGIYWFIYRRPSALHHSNALDQ